MKLKEVYDLVDGIILIILPEEQEIRYGNCYLKKPTSEMLESEIKSIEPFYNSKGLFKKGVYIYINE